MRCIFILLLIPSLSFGYEFRQKLTLDQKKAVWDKSCRISLYKAMDAYGSKVDFPSKRDRFSFIATICAMIAKDDAESIATSTLSPEEHACLSIANRTEMVVGFDKPLEAKGNNYEFANYCQTL